MSIKKFALSTLLILGVTSTPMMASANDLTIHNTTAYPVTSRLNQGVCSSIFNEITEAGKTHTTPDAIVRMACMTNLENCQADIYFSTDCSGNPIATAFFSVTRGFLTSTNTNRVYGSGFEVTIA